MQRHKYWHAVPAPLVFERLEPAVGVAVLVFEAGFVRAALAVRFGCVFGLPVFPAVKRLVGRVLGLLLAKDSVLKILSEQLPADRRGERERDVRRAEEAERRWNGCWGVHRCRCFICNCWSDCVQVLHVQGMRVEGEAEKERKKEADYLHRRDARGITAVILSGLNHLEMEANTDY